MKLFDQRDRPLENVRISVTDRCNFRCSYCMPSSQFPHNYSFLDSATLLSFEEIARLAWVFASLGVHKVRLTGGEPLIRPHLERLVMMLSEISDIDDIALTTNGYLLSSKATRLRCAGLRRLNVSLDSLDDDVFRRMNGGHAYVADVLKGIEAAEKAGFSPIKINTVVQRGVNDHTLFDLARYFRERGHIVRFIEFMDAGTLNGWHQQQVLWTDDLIQQLSRIAPLEPLPPNYPGEVVRRYRYCDDSGEVGFITSVSHPFCGDCNRLRISADGSMYTCLFARKGVNLREPMRAGESDEFLIERIAQVWRGRSDRYSEERGLWGGTPKVEMFHIGG